MFDLKQLKDLRKERKMKLYEVAEKIGVCSATVHNIENGKKANAGIGNVESILDVYGYKLVIERINKVNLPSQGTTETHIEETLG